MSTRLIRGITSYPRFKDEELEAKTDDVACLRSFNYKAAELGFEPRRGPFWSQDMKSTGPLAPQLRASSLSLDVSAWDEEQGEKWR